MQDTESMSGRRWTPEEVEKLLPNLEQGDALCKAVQEFKGIYWEKISLRVPGRTPTQCLHRWQTRINPGLIKGPWTPEVLPAY